MAVFFSFSSPGSDNTFNSPRHVLNCVIYEFLRYWFHFSKSGFFNSSTLTGARDLIFNDLPNMYQTCSIGFKSEPHGHGDIPKKRFINISFQTHSMNRIRSWVATYIYLSLLFDQIIIQTLTSKERRAALYESACIVLLFFSKVVNSLHKSQAYPIGCW